MEPLQAEAALAEYLSRQWGAISGYEADEAAAADAVEILPKEVDLDAIPPEVDAGLKEGRVTDFRDWEKVNAEEIRRGEEMGKERERMDWEEAHSFLAKVRS